MNLVFWILWAVLGAGVGVALVSAFRTLGFERDPATYPLVLSFIALLYVALTIGAGAEIRALIEAAVAIPFIALAVFGFRYSRWLVVVGLALHAGFDATYNEVLDSPGVPDIYPGLCFGFDLVLAGRMAFLRNRTNSHAPEPANP